MKRLRFGDKSQAKADIAKRDILLKTFLFLSWKWSKELSRKQREESHMIHSELTY